MESAEKRTLARIADLTHAGAVRAAAAFGQLANAVVEAGEPVVQSAPAWAGGASPAVGSQRTIAPATTGVFFEFEGCLDALVGILFPAEGGERLVRGVVGIESGELDPMIVESALMEVGNILASHVASGIADALRSRLLPSIPSLAPARADVEFDAWVERVVGREAARIEVRLALESGEIVGTLVVVPTEPSGDAGPDVPSRPRSVC